MQLVRSLALKREMLFEYPQLTFADGLDYEEYWRIRGTALLGEARARIIADLIEPGSSVLDVGCGNGAMLALIGRERHTRDLNGVDLSREAVRIATMQGVRAWQADANDAAFVPDRVYDYIICSEVLEHISEPERLLQRLAPYVGRRLIVTVPNTGYYLYRLRLLFGRFPVQWAHHPAEHLRFWTIPDFRWWAAQLGYDVERVIASNGLTLARLHRLLPNWFGLQMVFCLRPSAT